MKSARKSNGNRWTRPSRALGLFAIAGALGGLALVYGPDPAARRVSRGGKPSVVALQVPPTTSRGGKPSVVALQALPVPNAQGRVGSGPRLFKSDHLASIPTDHCLIEAPRVDDQFAFPGPRVDDQFVVGPRVLGLPRSGR